MDTVFCPICGKEYKDVNMHIRKGHGLDPEDVVEEAFGHRPSPEELRKGAPQQRRIDETMERINQRRRDLHRTQQKRMDDMRNAWQKRREEYDETTRERIANITKK